ncbi:hypothetical protein RUM43_010435 [Polyplax serrata]|uniref:Chitin-binding type-2 domain-containing protein n=1 Tax=Polyplax serrata TaxID=468196 RepID=A0AAN8Q4W0_POLSC
MFLLICCLVLIRAEVKGVTIPEYQPPSQEELLSVYFKNPGSSESNRTKKSISDVPDKIYKNLEMLGLSPASNFSTLKNESEIIADMPNTSGYDQDTAGRGPKKFHYTAIEATTYRYPTAVWSSETYEKLKSSHKYRPKPYHGRPSSSEFLGRDNNATNDKIQRPGIGKMVLKDYQQNGNPNIYEYGNKISRADFVDKFLEQSLSKYLASSNLKDSIGNVSVKTFSDILLNITGEKPKKLQSPYDENKELRMKFREEVILKKKNETKSSAKFLEKQLQKRLEKVQDMFNEKNKDKILANMWKYVALNRTAEVSDEKEKMKNEDDLTRATTAMEIVTPKPYNVDDIYITTASSEPRIKYRVTRNRGTIKYQGSKYLTTEKLRYNNKNNSDDGEEDRNNRNLLKLAAEESSYYRKGRFPSLTFIGQHPEAPGVIPGKPYVDYPIHSFPPPTKFKCPKFKGAKPLMMADKETRCQVFYVCTGDGPTTAMLCPNGTMFNENFHVCDWWYNVRC